MPFDCWYSFNAAWVFGPAMPSAGPASWPAAFSFSCACFTTSGLWLLAWDAVAPCDADDCPLGDGDDCALCDWDDCAAGAWASFCFWSPAAIAALIENAAATATANGESFIQQAPFGY